MSGIDIDDANSAIVYSGGWQALTGTVSAQFDETVHTTTNVGASATIKFSGTRIIVYLTVPAGTGTEAISTNMDGQLSSMARDSHAGTTYYQDRWFDSGILADGVHILTVSNAGTQGGTPLMLDKLNIEGAVITPVVAKPSSTTKSSTVVQGTTTRFATVTQVQTMVVSGSSSSSVSSSGSISATTSATASSAKTSSSGTALLDQTQSSTASLSEHTVISTQYVTSSFPGATTTPTSNTSTQTITSAAGTSKFPMAAIVGIVLGTLLLLVLLLFAACFLRRRRRRMAREAHVRLAGGDGDDGELSAGAARNPSDMRSMGGAATQRRRQTDVTPFRVEPSSASGYLMRKASQTGSEEYNAASADAHSPTYDAATVVGASTSASEKSPMSPIETAGPPGAPFNFDFNFATSHFSHVSAAPFSQYVHPGAPARQPETDAGPYPYTRRPQYLSGATLGGSTGSDIYASTLYPNPHHALANVDSRDVPPAYQSARNVGGGAASPAAAGTPDPRASGSRFSAMQQLRE